MHVAKGVVPHEFPTTCSFYRELLTFEPTYSTENEIKRALESLDVVVAPVQENTKHAFENVTHALMNLPADARPDLILWTHTQYNGLDKEAQLRMLICARKLGIPVVGYHLDRWWGLSREHLLHSEPFFLVDTLYTADGGPHDWKSLNINHKWLPPAVDEEQCKKGTPRDHFKSEIAFIGNWNGSYHTEHAHRFELVKWLRDTYGERVRFWPVEGQPAIRGTDLQDLIASCDVIVGDSCFTGTTRYVSDRIPETIGRGGFLLHPKIEGITDGAEYQEGKHLATWGAFDWQELKTQIDSYLADETERRSIADEGQRHVRALHTYRHRMERVLGEVL